MRLPLCKQVQFYATLETSEIVFEFEHALSGGNYLGRGFPHGGEQPPQRPQPRRHSFEAEHEQLPLPPHGPEAPRAQTVVVEELPEENDSSYSAGSRASQRREGAGNPRQPEPAVCTFRQLGS